MKLNEALAAIYAATEDTKIDVNIDGDRVQIHWCGVMRLECTPSVAAKAIPMIKQLEKPGMEDC